MQVAVIADTHVPGRARDLPPAAWTRLRDADVVIHAGDITAPSFLARLQERTRHLMVVRGNNDDELAALPEHIETTLDGVALGVVHDSGRTAGRRARLRSMFPRARVALFGHSHIPLLEDDGELLLLNPGSPTDRRRMPSFTMAILVLRSSAIADARIVDLGLQRASGWSSG